MLLLIMMSRSSGLQRVASAKRGGSSRRGMRRYERRQKSREASLRPWSRSAGRAPAAADRLALPAAHHVAKVNAAFRDAAAGVDKRNAELHKLHQQQEATREELDELLRQEAPPSEQELLDTRAQRDRGWQFVRSVWLAGNGDTDAISRWADGKPLETAYEAAGMEPQTE